VTFAWVECKGCVLCRSFSVTVLGRVGGARIPWPVLPEAGIVAARKLGLASRGDGVDPWSLRHRHAIAARLSPSLAQVGGRHRASPCVVDATTRQKFHGPRADLWYRVGDSSL
jgi:hypothetical protein